MIDTTINCIDLIEKSSHSVSSNRISHLACNHRQVQLLISMSNQISSHNNYHKMDEETVILSPITSKKFEPVRWNNSFKNMRWTMSASCTVWNHEPVPSLIYPRYKFLYPKFRLNNKRAGYRLYVSNSLNYIATPIIIICIKVW